MAASSSGSGSVCGSYQQVSDAIYEIHRPVSGEITMEVIFFHGYAWNDCEEAHIQTWMLRDNLACWLGTLLVQQFPQARVLSVSYDSSLKVSPSHGRMDMHLTGEYLAQSLIHCRNIGQHWPVVLVGHCVGGLVMKEVCLHMQRQSASTKSGIREYSNFLRNLRGLFFYGTPQQGSRMCLWGSSKSRNPLREYMELLSTESARINAEFAKSRIQYGWKTCGVMETDETQVRSLSIIRNLRKVWEWVSGYSPRDSFQLVEEASARPDMDDFCAIRGVDHFTICKPVDKTSDSFQHLVHFLQTICLEEESRKVGLENHLGLPDWIIEFGDRISEFMEALKLSEEGSKQILLVGMSGLGKSTLAKQVLMKIQSQFDYVCFVEILQQTLSRKDFWKLVVGNLYEGNGKQVSVELQDEWGTLKLLQGKKVLMMLDDCDDATDMTNHLKGLSYGEGSRLIVISRIQKDRSGFVKHVLPFLSRDHALTLFKARVQGSTLKAISKESVEQIVKTCEGLPLTLDVIGSSLQGQMSEKIWGSTLARLLEAGCIDGSKEDKLWGKLRVSFDSLGHEEKAIFLDLASFDMAHRQYDLTLFESAWKGSQSLGMSIQLSLMNLVDRSFIQIRNVKRLESYIVVHPYPVAYIHRQLRDMGRRISRPPEENVESCRGVWRPCDVEDILAKYKGKTTNRELQVLSMGMSDSVAVNLRRASKLRRKNSSCFDGRLSDLRRLRLLRMSDLNLIDSHQALRFPWPLRILHMNNCSRGEGKDSWLAEACWPIREEDVGNLPRLAVLIFDHCCSVTLPSNIQEWNHLKVIMIHATDLTRLPRNFGHLPCLERLDLQDVQIAELPLSILELASLRDLRLVDCLNFKSWPKKSIHVSNQLNSLTTLHLENLPALSELPDGFGAFESLTKLTMVNLPALRKLPDSFGAMSSLQTLMLEECNVLKRLPDRFGDLRRLETLDIRGCSELESLGEPFGGLHALKNLSLCNIQALEMLPHTIGQLASLERFTLGECGKLTMLQESFGELELLREIVVYDCCSLKYLWEDPKLGEYASSGEPGNTLINLQRLTVKWCPRFQALPQSLGQLPCLDYLDVQGSETFKCSPSLLRQLTRLKHLMIGGAVVPEDTKWKHGQTENPEPQRIGDDDESPGGTDLFPAKLGWVSGSTFEFPGDLTSLEYLNIHDYSSVGKLPECLSRLMVLRTLIVRKCINIPESIGLLKALTNLSVEGTFTSLPTGMWELKSLKYLTLTGGRFKDLPVSLGQLAALRTLELRQCDYLTHLPDSLGQLTSLRALAITNCKSLEKLPESLGKLASLHTLLIEGCVSLKTIPHSLGQLTSLARLIIDGCVSLVNDQANTNSRGQLKSLRNLTIKGCVSLHSLPEFLFDLIPLLKLVIQGCMFPDIIPGSLGQLKNLQRLDIKRSLSNNLVVDPLQYSSLKALIIEDCVSVNILPDSIGQLSFLESLAIKGCVSIRDFPDLLQVTSLKYLGIEGCPSLVVLPHSIGQLASLEKFTIKECASLVTIPDPLHLVSLQRLVIKGCTSLQTIPDSLGQLASLRRLTIKECASLISIPDPLHLVSLQRLVIKGCTSLRAIPDSLGQLASLRWLTIKECASLISIPEPLHLVSLNYLAIEGCTSLRAMPNSMGQLKSLTDLILKGCTTISSLPDSLGELASLKVLNTDGCISLKDLPRSMGQLRLLETLCLSGCFEDLPEWLGQFAALKDLEVRHCPRLKYLPESLGQLTALRCLRIVKCEGLENLPDSLGQLTSLKWLSVKESVSLQSIPDKLEELNSLKSLVIKRSVSESVNKVPECLGQLACSEIGPFASLPTSLRQLICLKELTLMGENVAYLPDWLWQMPALTDLKIQQCDHLSHMPDVSSLGQVITLESLAIVECKALQNLPESIGNIAALERLVIKGCISLENIPDSLGQLAHLTDLHIEGCVGVKAIPDSLRQLHDLGYLYADSYLVMSVAPLRSLKGITVAGEYSEDLLGALQLAQFPALNELRLLRCDYLMHLPDLLRSTSLNHLFIGDVLFMDPHYLDDDFGSNESTGRAQNARKKLGPRQYLEIHDVDNYYGHRSTYFPVSMEQLMSLKYVHVTGQTSLRVLESLWRLQSKIITC